MRQGRSRTQLGAGSLPSHGSRPGWVLPLVVALTALAAFLRLYRIDRLPPGDGYDPAVYGLDALAILEGARPVYLPTNFGREALFSYVVAACVLALGIGPHAIYTASALVGVLTVPAVYLAADEVFASAGGLLARYGGLLAAAATAFSYWHLSWSRLGVRAITVPLLAATTTYLLWRALRTGSRWAFAACGLSLGLSLYTYQAARLLPLLVVLGLVAVWRSRRAVSRRDLLNAILVLGLALAVFAPMGWYLATHPGTSAERIRQTLAIDPSAGLGGNLRTLWAQVQEAVLVFFVRGDNWPKVNAPGRAALNPFLALAFLLGLGASLLRIRQPPFLFLLSWLGVMSAPAILAGHGPVTKRAIGALPAAMMIAAVGCAGVGDAVRRWTARRRPAWRRGVGAGLAVLIAAGLAWTGVGTYRDYLSWGENPDLFTYFEAGLSATGAYIRELSEAERVYLSSVSPGHPSVVFNSGAREGVKGYNGRVCLVLADAAAQDTTYLVVPAQDKQGLSLLEAYLPQGEVAGEGPLHYGQPYFVAYRVPAGAEAQVRPAHEAGTNWDDKILLVGYDMEERPYKAGDTVDLTLYYGALDAMDVDYTAFVHLVGPQPSPVGEMLWAQNDSEPCQRYYPTSGWDRDEIVVDPVSLSLPADVPPGTYAVRIGFYEWQTMTRLPVLEGSGQAVGDYITLCHLEVGGDGPAGNR